MADSNDKVIEIEGGGHMRRDVSWVDSGGLGVHHTVLEN